MSKPVLIAMNILQVNILIISPRLPNWNNIIDIDCGGFLNPVLNMNKNNFRYLLCLLICNTLK